VIAARFFGALGFLGAWVSVKGGGGDDVKRVFVLGGERLRGLESRGVVEKRAEDGQPALTRGESGRTLVLEMKVRG
jgi:hypothetical protein